MLWLRSHQNFRLFLWIFWFFLDSCGVESVLDQHQGNSYRQKQHCSTECYVCINLLLALLAITTCCLRIVEGERQVALAAILTIKHVGHEDTGATLFRWTFASQARDLTILINLVVLKHSEFHLLEDDTIVSRLDSETKITLCSVWSYNALIPPIQYTYLLVHVLGLLGGGVVFFLLLLTTTYYFNIGKQQIQINGSATLHKDISYRGHTLIVDVS